MNGADFDRMTDEVLVKQSQSGDDASLLVIIARYTPIIKNHASGYYGSDLEPEDLAQEGMIGLLRAVRTYSYDKGASFKTYALLCIDRSIISIVRRALSSRRIPDANKVSIEQTLAADELFCDGPEDEIIKIHEAHEILEKFKAILSDVEYRVFMLYIGGCTYEEIAQRLDLSRKAVDNALYRIKKKLKDFKI